MTLITSLAQLRHNLAYLESHYGSREHLAYVKRGTCFVVYDGSRGTAFAPSRFVGYENNTFTDHNKRTEKNGRDTNPAISLILGSPPEPQRELEDIYKRYCERLGFSPNARGSFGVERKFWDLRGIN